MLPVVRRKSAAGSVGLLVDRRNLSQLLRQPRMDVFSRSSSNALPNNPFFFLSLTPRFARFRQPAPYSAILQ